MSTLEVLQDVSGASPRSGCRASSTSRPRPSSSGSGDLAVPHGSTRIVMDLRDLRFMDSTGLRLLVTADLRLRREGRELALIPGPESVHRVFRLAMLEERLTFVDGSPIGDGGGA